MNKDFTKEWRETFTMDFEGKYQRVITVPVYTSSQVGSQEPVQYFNYIKKNANQKCFAFFFNIVHYSTVQGILY